MSNLKIYNKLESKENLGFDTNKKLILIIGGSQGARAINYYIYENIDFFIKNNYQLYWQCGYNDIKKLNKIQNKSIKIIPFIKDMSKAYSSADLVISRAGAISISELIMKKATIFIPLPSAADNHQEINSKFLAQKKACVSIHQSNLKNRDLEKTISNLFTNNKNLEELENNIEKFCNKDSTKLIVKEILEEIK